MIIEGHGYLVDPNNQFVLRNGSPNVAGIVRVYYAGTDDIAKTYCDFEGTRNPADIRLDNNGRAIIIADVTKAYRIEVRDSNGGLLWPVSPVFCGGGGGGVVPVELGAPLVGVKNLTTKMFGDDGFIKENAFGNDAFFIPDGDWYNVGIRAVLSSETPRDAIETFSIDFEWNFKIADAVPPGSYAAGWPKMSTELDLTRAFTREVSTSFLYSKANAGSDVNDWLGWWKHVPTGVTCDVFIELFKVRDA